MRTLVTGGAGFIGSHVVDALLARGDEVTVLDDLSTGRRENLEAALTSGALLIEADVSEAEPVKAAFDTCRPEIVFHLAAQIDVRVSVADPLFDLRVNAGGTINVLRAAARTGTGRFILASTGGAIYGEGTGRELPLSEDAECLPDAPYGQSKLAAEGYAALWARLQGLPTIALRLGNIYGPRQDPLGEAGVVAIFAGAMLNGRRPRVYGDGRQTRDYTYVGDVVGAFLAAGAFDATGPYNAGTGVETSVLELGSMVASACGVEFDPEPAPARLGEIERIAIDSSRAAADLGWRAATPLADGLGLTVDSLRP